jgi:hypothetical protein
MASVARMYEVTKKGGLGLTGCFAHLRFVLCELPRGRDTRLLIILGSWQRSCLVSV